MLSRAHVQKSPKENVNIKKSSKPVTTTSPDDDIRTRESEVKDSKLIFEIAWNNIVDKIGDDKMTFPKDIM